MPDELYFHLPFAYKTKFHDMEWKIQSLESNTNYNTNPLGFMYKLDYDPNDDHKIAETQLALNYATHANTNDPSTDQKAAMSGTDGTPSSANKFVTNSDTRNQNAREPTAHNSTLHLDGYLSNTIPYAVNTDSRFTDSREPTAHNSSFHSVIYPTNTLHYAHVDNGSAHGGSMSTHGNEYHSPGFLSNTAPYAVNTDLRFADAREPVSHNSVLHSVLYAPIATNGYVAPTQLGPTPTSALFLRGDNTWQAPPSDPWTYLVLNTEFRTPLSAGANVSALTFTPAGSTNYDVQGMFFLKTATATVGARPGVGWPTGMATGVAIVEATVSNSSTVIGLGHLGDAIQAIVTALPETTNYYPATLFAVMASGASPTGIFRVTLASETNATNVYMGVGSYLKYRSY